MWAGAAVVLVGLLLSAGCSRGADRTPPPTRTPVATSTPVVTTVCPDYGLGPLPASAMPTSKPVQAGTDIAGSPLPTNQWWTSALTGPWMQVLWAFPIVARADQNGIEVSGTLPVASTNAVTMAFVPALRIAEPLTRLRVERYDAFSVTVAMIPADGNKQPMLLTVAQGDPVMELDAGANEVWLELAPGSTVTANGSTLAAGGSASASRVHIASRDQNWDIAVGAGATWALDRDRLHVTSSSAIQLVAGPTPSGADATWLEFVADAASHPLTGTTTSIEPDLEAGVVRQTLTWEREDGETGVVALLPHHREYLASDDATPVAGTYATSRGQLTLVRASSIDLEYPLPGLLPAVPDVGLSDAERDAIGRELARDLTDVAGRGGSYWDPKLMGRSALLAEIANRIGANAARTAALADVRLRLDDWLTYAGASDERWIAYDSSWGGIIAVPSEYGESDYNDHHFQFGYLLRSAATLAAFDPGFAACAKSVLDQLAADLLGGASGFPDFRVFNPYEGHSYASGFGATPDGSNQESSSEAVHAWESIVEWGMATGNQALIDAGLARYAAEAATARTYWLGEDEDIWPAGFDHSTAGIVWGGKVDFATFFDARPQAIIGIQLLPFTFGSLYRSGTESAPHRVAEADRATAVDPFWSDLVVMEQALYDPQAAASRLGAPGELESGNSHAMLRYWVTALGHLGTVAEDVHADQPYGLAFDSPAGRAYVGVNPSASPVTVRFIDITGAEVHRLVLEPGASRTER